MVSKYSVNVALDGELVQLPLSGEVLREAVVECECLSDVNRKLKPRASEEEKKVEGTRENSEWEGTRERRRK